MSNVDASTWRELVAETTELLGSRNEARWLCEEACGLFGADFMEELDQPASQRMGLSLRAMVGRRLAGEPLQYVLGHWPFRHVDLLVDPRVLIPRPETELVAEVAIGLAREAHGLRRSFDEVMRAADLGTGSGAIGLSMANELPTTGVEVWITDVSDAALDVARANISGIGRNAANVRVAHGNWCEALPNDLRGCFDVIVANPPYIAIDDNEVDEAVRQYEPHNALFADNQGLADIFLIADQSREWLTDTGWLVLELGHRQGDLVRDELTRLGFDAVDVRPDLAGRDRVAVAQRG